MQNVANDIQRVSRYCRRAGTDNRFMFQFTNKIANMQISVTKRVTPFRNTVTLVHHNHKNIRMLYSFNKRMVLQPFGSDIEKVQFPLTSLAQYLIYLLFRAGHIDIIDRHIMLLQRLHLIVNQSKQRLDNDSQLVGMSKPNGFIDDLFTTSSGSNHNRILFSIQRIHRDNLCLARLVKAKLFECRFQVSFHIHRDNLQCVKIIFMLSECKKIMSNSEHLSKINYIFDLIDFLLKCLNRVV